MGIPGERRDFLRGVVPILQECELRRLDCGAMEAEMGIAPWAEALAVAHVFIADIEAAGGTSQPSAMTSLRWLRKLSWKRLPQPPWS